MAELADDQTRAAVSVDHNATMRSNGVTPGNQRSVRPRCPAPGPAPGFTFLTSAIRILGIYDRRLQSNLHPANSLLVFTVRSSTSWRDSDTCQSTQCSVLRAPCSVLSFYLASI